MIRLFRLEAGNAINSNHIEFLNTIYTASLKLRLPIQWHLLFVLFWKTGPWCYCILFSFSNFKQTKSVCDVYSNKRCSIKWFNINERKWTSIVHDRLMWWIYLNETSGAFFNVHPIHDLQHYASRSHSWPPFVFKLSPASVPRHTFFVASILFLPSAGGGNCSFFMEGYLTRFVWQRSPVAQQTGHYRQIR